MGLARPSRASSYRTGIFVGSCLTLLGIAAALASEAVVSPLALLAGWLIIAWSTHRMGRSGPSVGWPTSHSATPQPRRLNQG